MIISTLPNLKSHAIELFMFNQLQRLAALDRKRRFALGAASSHEEEVGRLRSEHLNAHVLLLYIVNRV